MIDDLRHILKVHEDITTVPKEITKLYKEYKELGYSMLSKYPSSFAYKLEDNTVILVFWKDGVIYEDVALFPNQQMNPEFEKYSFDNSSGLEI